MSEIPYTEENPEFDASELTFEQLKQAVELARTTFTQTENGFRNVNGDVIEIKESKGVYKIVNFPAQSRCPKLHNEVMFTPEGEIIQKGSPDREEMIAAIKALLEKTENRIIE